TFGRAVDLYTECMPKSLSRDKIKDKDFWTANQLVNLFYWCVIRYTAAHTETADQANDIVDAAYCRPIADDIRSAAETALNFVAGISEEYKCVNGTLKRRACFDDSETCAAFFSLYTLVDYLGGSCEDALHKYDDWKDSALSLTDPYAESFSQLKSSVFDLATELRHRRAALSEIPDNYSLSNSLSSPSRFIGGEQR
ncbi:hypothetical protein KY329_00785, partial [Candidatus Woesearchaeota archaeon]|nr:hypothetical protein [Candidatus Woesearchaeota archaeon]